MHRMGLLSIDTEFTMFSSGDIILNLWRIA